MRNFNIVSLGMLDEASQKRVQDIRSAVGADRGSSEKLRRVFNHSVLTAEWVNTSVLMLVTNLGHMAVHNGIADLNARDEIEGKSMTYVEYFEMLRERRTPGAKLLVAIACARFGCTPDEISLVSIMLPDVERTSESGESEKLPFSGYYFRAKTQDSSEGDGLNKGEELLVPAAVGF